MSQLDTEQTTRANFAALADALAENVVRALRGMDDAYTLSAAVDVTDEKGALAAVRVLGVDALAPHLLSGRRLDRADVELVLAGLRAFPSLSLDRELPAIPRVRDWLTSWALASMGVAGLDTDWPAEIGPGFGRQPGWASWCTVMARLSTLALPGVHCPLHEDARRFPADLERGIARSILRRDHRTAARLARWRAFGGGAKSELSLTSVLRHLELVAGNDPRVLLDVVVATRMVEGIRR
ncbi:hypothetical protein [Actinoalloteichus hymeniacidonis]|uniref:Uncharacterized protein n=1 Tax=Actinoalloteichus hymeniacidonis TaxID=340345 RepID=A0AAC9MYT8_9PSEU|nr:hypothetical protein [Actinoalloteichus hymeniacidonis]AOS63660.1 hypothetical protein TL08_14230 [Actinoalloteichus hymeniacidonis]MBB5908292.1 hypothetical protein [Actinoalloteichus hymeniacidonis]